MMVIDGKHIVLGITGGIAAYKAAEICSQLVKGKAVVDVIMTEAATRFIAPLTLQTLSRRRVYGDMFGPIIEHAVTHVSLAEQADAILIAPATAIRHPSPD